MHTYSSFSPIRMRLSGIYRMNGFGQRKFLNDGTFIADLVDEHLKSTSSKEEENCTMNWEVDV